jgi:hypothetical protein
MMERRRRRPRWVDLRWPFECAVSEVRPRWVWCALSRIPFYLVALLRNLILVLGSGKGDLMDCCIKINS